MDSGIDTAVAFLATIAILVSGVGTIVILSKLKSWFDTGSK